jgi:hypothetical protein
MSADVISGRNITRQKKKKMENGKEKEESEKITGK